MSRDYFIRTVRVFIQLHVHEERMAQPLLTRLTSMGTDNFVSVIMLGRQSFAAFEIHPNFWTLFRLAPSPPTLEADTAQKCRIPSPWMQVTLIRRRRFALGDREPFCCLAISLLKFSRDGIAICNDRVGRKPPLFQRPRSLADWDKGRAHFMWVQGCALSNRDNFVIKVAHKRHSAYFRF